MWPSKASHQAEEKNSVRYRGSSLAMAWAMRLTEGEGDTGLWSGRMRGLERAARSIAV